MVQRLPDTYRIDPADPRAPSQDVWDRMTIEERARVVSMLPDEVPNRYTSEVLGLDLAIEGEKLRFLLGLAAVPEAEELIARLGTMLDQVLVHKQDAEERARAESARADMESASAASLRRQLTEAEQKLAEAEALIAQLRRGE